VATARICRRPDAAGVDGRHPSQREEFNMTQTFGSSALALFGFAGWQVGLIVGLAVLIVILLIVRKKQQE